MGSSMESNPTYSMLADLNLKSVCCRIVVRLLRSWEARNFKRNRELMSVDFLLLDEKDSMIQGSIHHQRVERFRDSLREGAIFVINDFDIVRSNTRYKLTDHPFMIRFTDQTTMVQVENEKYSIQQEKFRVRSYDDLLELADKNQDLPDVIGLICTIKKPELDEEGPTKKVELRLLLEEGVKVRVTIWEDLTKAFCAKLDEIEEKRIMIIVTSINPKIFGGELYLNSTSSTKFYLNAEFDIVRDFCRRINMEEQLSEIHKSSGASVCDKQQCCSISDIFAFLSTEEAQEKEFTCMAKVTNILMRNGWSYVSCSKCSKKMTRGQSMLTCDHCHNPQAVGVLRFRIELVVDDGKDTATFVLFDRDAKKLTNKTAGDLMTVHETDADNVGQDQTAPPCIRAIVGRIFQFQVKVTKYNFRTTYQTFTVSRILDENCTTQIKEEKQTKDFAVEGQSAESCSTTIQEIKRELGNVETNTGKGDNKRNKKQKLQKTRITLED